MGGEKRPTEDNASLQALERAGERFMAMFDDEDEGGRPKNKKGGERRAPSDGPPRATSTSTKVGKAKGASKRRRGEGEYDAADVAFDASAGAKRKRVGADSQLRATAAAASSRRDPEVVVFSGDRPNLAASRAGALSEDVKRRAKRLFMSDSIARVHEVAKPKADPSVPADKHGAAGGVVAGDEPAGEVAGLTGASLNDMRKQVQAFGATGLDKWSRKSLEQKTRVALGAKAEKGVRTPPTVGVGMWKKNEAREEARRIEIFDAGGKLAKKKRGLRKADLAEHAESRDRGLAWGSGNFRGGVLTVSKKDLAREKNAGPGAAYLAGTKLSGADGKRAGGKRKNGTSSKKNGRPQGGGKKGTKKR